MKESAGRIALITGGAGFIGSNLAQRLLADDDVRVRIFDNLSRPGVIHNISWLHSLPGSRRLEVVRGDVRDAAAVRKAAADATEIYHLAAQVAVTTSVDNPALDFEVNAGGTFHVLEAARISGRNPFVLFTSTNKVYGSLQRIPVEMDAEHYRSSLPDFCGVDESEPLDFHSPYGCSKGAADQYVHDYARIYQIPTVVFRMSCIAGPRQFGNEDQGWVAHFLYSVLATLPLTIYGTGYQVRDVLHVHDLVDAMLAARNSMATTGGHVFNLGGGQQRAVSVMELLAEIERRFAVKPVCNFREVRPGDQPLYVSNTAKLEQLTGWKARRSLVDTLDSIYEFWQQHREAIIELSAQRSEQSTAEEMEAA